MGHLEGHQRPRQAVVSDCQVTPPPELVPCQRVGTRDLDTRLGVFLILYGQVGDKGRPGPGFLVFCLPLAQLDSGVWRRNMFES